MLQSINNDVFLQCIGSLMISSKNNIFAFIQQYFKLLTEIGNTSMRNVAVFQNLFTKVVKVVSDAFPV